jgi:hypothetical protein
MIPAVINLAGLVSAKGRQMANEDVFANRRGNLRALIIQHEGATNLAKLLGYSSPSYLSQMVGPNPTRQITEKVARQVERKLLLPDGWLDKKPTTYQVKVDEQQIGALVLLVGQILKENSISVTPEQFANLVTLANEREAIDETYIRRLINLIQPNLKK